MQLVWDVLFVGLRYLGNALEECVVLHVIISYADLERFRYLQANR
jgi:hypothetical protein